MIKSTLEKTLADAKNLDLNTAEMKYMFSDRHFYRAGGQAAAAMIEREMAAQLRLIDMLPEFLTLARMAAGGHLSAEGRDRFADLLEQLETLL